MPHPHPLPRVSATLAAFACLLVLLASGDDFNLARAALPLPAPDPGATLPLDDPNTDFTEAPQDRGQTAADPLPCDGPGAAGRGPVRTAVVPPARGHSTRNSINSPLRC
jgi:hypothetical protein